MSSPAAIARLPILSIPIATSLRFTSAIDVGRLILTDTDPSWWRVTANAGGGLAVALNSNVTAVADATNATNDGGFVDLLGKRRSHVLLAGSVGGGIGHPEIAHGIEQVHDGSPFRH